MADYKEMYITLFREMTKAIAILQKAQQITEEIYISGDSNGNSEHGGLDCKADDNA